MRHLFKAVSNSPFVDQQVWNAWYADPQGRWAVVRNRDGNAIAYRSAQDALRQAMLARIMG